MMKVKALCMGEADAPKERVEELVLSEEGGVAGETAGDGFVRLVSFDEAKAFRRSGTLVKFGEFGEHMTLDGISSEALCPRLKLQIGEVLLEIAEIKERGSLDPRRDGALYVPRTRALAKILQGGTVRTDDEVSLP